MTTQPCDLHDLTNCAYCNGTERSFQDSLADGARDRGLPERRQDGGPVISSRFSGFCKSCGRRYEEGSTIQHSRDHDGWIAECCQ